MSYKITDTIIVDNNKNIGSIGIATFAGPVIIGGGTSTGTVSQPLQVTGTNGAYIGGNLGIGSTNPSSKLWVSGDIYNAGVHTAYVLNASKDPGTGIATDFTNSLFGNGWRVSSPGSTTYYKLATLPPGGGGGTFDHLVINGVLGAWTNGNQTPFEITFSNRGTFNYKYVSYGSVRSDVRIIGISTNSNVEIWAQHQVSQFTKLVYNIPNSIESIVVSNPTSTVTAPVGTTVFDSSTAIPRFIINESDNVGVGTINPTQSLHVQGNVRITGGLYDSNNNVGTAGSVLSSTGSGLSWIAAAASGAPAYASSAGIATNLNDGLAGNIVYQSAPNTTAFLANGTSNYVLQSNGVGNAPTWVPAAPSGAVTGLVVRDSSNNIVGTSGSITQLTFSTGLSVTGTAGAAGIATITLSSNIVGSALSISGISTFTNGPVLIGSGTSTGTASQTLQVTGGAYVSGNLGVGRANPAGVSSAFTEIYYASGDPANATTALQVGMGAHLPSTSTRQYGIKVNQLGGRYAPQTGIRVDIPGTSGLFGGPYYGVEAYTLTSSGTHQTATSIVGVSSNTDKNYGNLNIGVEGTANSGTNSYVAGYGSILEGAVGGKFVAYGKAQSIGVYADAYLLASPGAGQQAIPFLAASNGTELLRITSAGNLLVGSATSTGTASQRLQVDGGAYVSGSVGIGTTNPGATLNVVPTATSIAGLFSGTTSSDMVRITQLGTGNALVVEDSANPDSSPFVVTGIGSVGIGTASPAFTADIAGDARVTSTNKMRFGGTAGTTNFYIQYNSTANSLDFVAG